MYLFLGKKCFGVISFEKNVFCSYFLGKNVFEKIHHFLNENLCVSIKTIKIQFVVDVETIQKIIHEDLNMCKICSQGTQWWTDGKMHWVTAWRWLMGIKTVSHSPYSPDLWLGCSSSWRRTLRAVILKMKEAVTRVLETFTLDVFHGIFTKWVECCNKYIEVRRSNFGWD